jgi:protein-arginine kinase activator protein McsA
MHGYYSSLSKLFSELFNENFQYKYNLIEDDIKSKATNIVETITYEEGDYIVTKIHYSSEDGKYKYTKSTYEPKPISKEELEKQLNEAIANQEFEKAAVLRDKLKNL